MHIHKCVDANAGHCSYTSRNHPCMQWKDEKVVGLNFSQKHCKLKMTLKLAFKVIKHSHLRTDHILIKSYSFVFHTKLSNNMQKV